MQAISLDLKKSVTLEVISIRFIKLGISECKEGTYLLILHILSMILSHNISDLFNVSQSSPHFFIHFIYVINCLVLLILEAESQFNSVMLTHELEELVLDTDASS